MVESLVALNLLLVLAAAGSQPSRGSLHNQHRLSVSRVLQRHGMFLMFGGSPRNLLAWLLGEPRHTGSGENGECRHLPCTCHYLAVTSYVPCMLLTTPTLLGECGPGLRQGQAIRCFTSESSYHKTLLLLGFIVCSQ